MAVSRVLTTTFVVVSTQDKLTANLESNTTINLGDDILLKSPKAESPTGIVIKDGQAGLLIDGRGLYSVDGQNAVRYFYIGGNSARVVIQNLVITRGSGNGGGLYIKGGEIRLKSCTISLNKGVGVNYGGGLYITSSATVSLTNCAIVNNKAHRAGGIDLDDGQLLLAGCLVSDNEAYGSSDLMISDGSYLTVLSSCPGDSFNAGQGTLECTGCNTTHPADLLNGECAPCPALDPYSCCGSQSEAECQNTTSSTCSEDELSVCGAVPTPQPAPSLYPTPFPLLPEPTPVPTFLLATKSSSSATFTALIVIASSAAIVIAFVLRWCFNWRTRQKYSSRKSSYTKEDITSPFHEVLHGNDEFETGPEHIYSAHSGDAQKSEDGRMVFKSSGSEMIAESHDIASTYGADRSVGSIPRENADHGAGEYAHANTPLDKLVLHLCRHGLERKESETLAKYLSVTFGVQSMGDFRLLEEADIIQTAEDVELLKVQTSKLRIAWR